MSSESSKRGKDPVLSLCSCSLESVLVTKQLEMFLKSVSLRWGPGGDKSVSQSVTIRLQLSPVNVRLDDNDGGGGLAPCPAFPLPGAWSGTRSGAYSLTGALRLKFFFFHSRRES